MDNTESIRVAFLGAAGRMGLTLVRCAHRARIELVGAVDRPEHADIGADIGLLAGLGATGLALTADVHACVQQADVLIDFSFHEVVPEHVRAAYDAHKPIVIGVTGLTEEEAGAVRDCAKQLPILWAPNMSVGVNLLFALTRQAAQSLGPAYDIEIIETHHRHKRDAPSGTALRLAERAAEGRELDLRAVAVYGREGDTGERPRDQIGIHAVRGGEVAGEHMVLFAGEAERIELVHRASGREAFALGALHGARWLLNREPGLYDMQDVLGLNAD